jgi:hypothetical protein
MSVSAHMEEVKKILQPEHQKERMGPTYTAGSMKLRHVLTGPRESQTGLLLHPGWA